MSSAGRGTVLDIGQRILIQCSTVDRHLINDGKRFSPIIDRVKSDSGFAKFEILDIPKFGDLVSSRDWTVSTEKIGSAVTFFLLRAILLVRLNKVFTFYLTRIYESVLRRKNCGLVIAIQPELELIRASNKVGIRVVDCLHGYGIRNDHAVYGEGALKRARSDLCSDYVALDRVSQAMMQKYIDKNDISIHSVRPASLDTQRVFLPPQRGQDKVAVITLQWGINRFESAYPHVDGELHPKIAVLVNNTPEILYVVKPHPVLLKNVLIENKLNELELRFKNLVIEREFSVVELFNSADFHVTIWSSSVKEAAFVGIKSFLFSSDDFLFKDTGLFSTEFEMGLAERVSGVDDEAIVDKVNEATLEDKQIQDYQLLVLPSARNLSEVLDITED